MAQAWMAWQGVYDLRNKRMDSVFETNWKDPVGNEVVTSLRVPARMCNYGGDTAHITQ